MCKVALNALQMMVRLRKDKNSTLTIPRDSIMAQMKLIEADDMKDKLWGKRGTPEREAMEAQLKDDVDAYVVGER